MALGPRRHFIATCYFLLQMALGPRRRFEETCYPHLEMALNSRRHFLATCYLHLQMALDLRRRFEWTCYSHLEMALGHRKHFQTTCYLRLPMLRSVRSWKWGERVHRNVGIWLPINAASRNRRSESSTRQMRKFVCCDCELATGQNLSNKVQWDLSQEYYREGGWFCFIPWFVLCKKSW
jgi:hypothetical protein